MVITCSTVCFIGPGRFGETGTSDSQGRGWFSVVCRVGPLTKDGGVRRGHPRDHDGLHCLPDINYRGRNLFVSFGLLVLLVLL